MLRPRYSLLTLLILTALVAGGVKLWYAPHHVVEQTHDEGVEREYTFTRDWLGNKTIHGPYVIRSAFPEGTMAMIQISYFRDDQALKWTYYFENVNYLQLNLIKQIQTSLSEDENREFESVVDAERGRMQGLEFTEGYIRR